MSDTPRTREEIDLAYDHWLAENKHAPHHMESHGWGRSAWHEAYDVFASPLERELAELRERTIEECAKVCEEQIAGYDYHHLAINGKWDIMAQATVNCASAVRALKKAKP